MQWLDEETSVEIDSQKATSQSTIIPSDEVRTGCAHCPYKWTSDGHLLKLTSTSWWALHTEKKGKQLNVDTNVKMQSDCLVSGTKKKRKKKRERERAYTVYISKIFVMLYVLRLEHFVFILSLSAWYLKICEFQRI